MSRSPRLIGQTVPRQDSDAPLRGTGCYAGDVTLTAPLHLHILRSLEASAEIRLRGLDAALAVPGVLAVHTGADVADLGRLPINPVLPLLRTPDFPILAQERISAIGQPVAAILAETPAQGAAAADLIDMECQTLPRPASEKIAMRHWQTEGTQTAFDAAHHVVSASLDHPVLAPASLEPRTISIEYQPQDSSVTIWQSTQTPHRTRDALADILSLDPARLRVIAPDVGGAFGMKGSVYPEEVLAVWAAFHHRRSVRWTASRSEEFMSATHGRGLRTEGRLALDQDGRFLAMEARVNADLGHWVPNSGLIPAWNAGRVLPSGYDIAQLDVETNAWRSAHPPRGIYRGAGRPEANALMERLVDEAAQVTGLDPIALRQLNLLQPEQLPHETALGNRLDSGSYGALLDVMRHVGGYDAACTSRDQRRAEGEIVGVGLAFYVEPSGEGWESARVTLGDDGRAHVASGSSNQGQSRATAYAQIAAEALDLPIESVTVIWGDTETCPPGIGALASRSTPIGGSAVLDACRQVAARRAAGETGAITVETRYQTEGQAWGYGAFMAVVSVDPETGVLTPERLTCVDDTGRIVNPALVKGQLTGGTAQGLGEALLEEIHFDADGQLLTGSFMDYAMPRAADMPPIDIHSVQTASPFNILGAKGVGEAGTIGAPPALLNAALDALRPLGVTDLTMPLTPCRIWQAMQAATKDQTR